MKYLAQVDISNPNINPTAKFSSVASLVNLITPLLIGGAALGLLAMFIYAAFNIITAGGDPQKIAKGRNIATYAIIGIVLVVMAYTFVKLMAYFFGIQVPL